MATKLDNTNPKNINSKMTLNKEIKYGLTFGQILSALTLFGAIMLAWVNVNQDITANKVRIEALERGRIDNATNIGKLFDLIESSRKETKSDFKDVIGRLDEIQKTVK